MKNQKSNGWASKKQKQPEVHEVSPVDMGVGVYGGKA